jgi:hypothetical protein
VASDADGDFVVAFAGDGVAPGESPGGSDVFARRFVGGYAPVVVGGPVVAGVEDIDTGIDLGQYFTPAGGVGGLRYYVVGDDGLDATVPDYDQHDGPLLIRFGEAYAGETDAFIVRAVDDAGRWSETAIHVTVEGVNDAPGVNAPDRVAAQALGPVVLSSSTDGNGFYVGDTEDRFGDAPLRVHLVARGGTITLSGMEGVTFEEGDGTGDVTMTFTAPSYLANRALDGMRFDPATPVTRPTGVTITVDDLGNVGSGGPKEWTKDLPILFAPVVTGVFVAGSRWRREFLQALWERDLGDKTYGFSIRGGPGQLATLPWATIDQVSIRFSHDVYVNKGHLRVRSGRGTGYSPVAFSYDPVTHTATWTLDRPIAADRVVIDTTTMLRAIGTPDGTFLVDGEWTDGASHFPSGDGAPGGMFEMKLNVFPGDVDRNGVVNAFDAVLLRRRVGTSATWSPERYDPFHDLDGDGRIGAVDMLHQRRRKFSTLPPPA